MLYDQLLGLCERHARDLVPIVANARLFDFPHVPHEVLSKYHTPETRDFFNQYFALPFPLVAVEDQASVIVMWDSRHDAVGLGVARQFIECVKFEAKHLVAFKEITIPKGGLSQEEQLAMRDLYSISSGILHKVKAGENTYLASASLVNVLVVSKRHGVQMSRVDFRLNALDLVTRSAARNAITAIEEFMHFNGPDRFVVSVAPTNPRKKPKKIPRSMDRTRYILLTPAEIRERWKLPESEGASKATHQRRRHVRMYPDDEERWPNVHGTVRVIPACWVGPHQAVVGNKKYRICLEL